MIPTSLVALLIVGLFVLPGSVYTWAFERQVSGYGLTLTDRTLRFIAVSISFHVLLGWPEYWLYRAAFSTGTIAAGQFTAAWSLIQNPT